MHSNTFAIVHAKCAGVQSHELVDGVRPHGRMAGTLVPFGFAIFQPDRSGCEPIGLLQDQVVLQLSRRMVRFGGDGVKDRVDDRPNDRTPGRSNTPARSPPNYAETGGSAGRCVRT